MADQGRRDEGSSPGQPVPPHPPGGSDLMITAIGGFRSWEDVWEPFRRRHADWWARFSVQGPVYCIPPPVIQALAHSVPGGRKGRQAICSLIPPQAVAAERDFTEVCRGNSGTTVGVWDDRPLAFPLLNFPSVRSFESRAEEDWEALGWGDYISLPQYQAWLNRFETAVDAHHHQRLGYVGRLTFDDQYRREKAVLKARWLELHDRPPFPLRATAADCTPICVPSTQPFIDRIVAVEGSRFLEDVGGFLRKWQLVGLVTWDLPEPQGPLESVPLGLARELLGPDQSVSAVPSYHDIPSNVDVRDRTREEQARAAKDAGIELEHPVTDISARAGSPSTFENAFRLWLIERTVRDRYGSPRGVVSRLVPAFAQILGCSDERVSQLRRTYKRHLVD